MADQGPPPPPVTVPEGEITLPVERPMKRKQAEKPERLVDKAQLDVHPFVVAHNKEVKLTQVKIDEDRSKGQIRTLDKERVKSIYEGLKTTVETL